jgi:hypothetical protein
MENSMQWRATTAVPWGEEVKKPRNLMIVSTHKATNRNEVI